MPDSNRNKEGENSKQKTPPGVSVERRRTSVHPAAAPPPPAQLKLYRASHFRYTCNGYFHANSKTKGGIGTCRGIRSAVNLVEDWHWATTRKDALRSFEDRVGDEGGGGSHHGPAGTTTTGSGQVAELDMMQVPGMIVYDPDESEVKTPDKGEPKNGENSSSNSTGSLANVMPVDEVIGYGAVSGIGEYDWKCYGRTEVDLLVLRPEGAKQSEERTVAVAPFCSPGYSAQSVVMPANRERINLNNVTIGFLQIVWSHDQHIEDDDTNAAVGAQSSVKGDPNRKAGPMEKPGSKIQSSAPGNSGSQDQSSATDQRGWLNRMYTSGGKIFTHMQQNTKIIAESVQDDFPQRTYAASQRILQDMSKTPQRLSSVVTKLVRMLNDDGDDDDNGRRK